MKELNLIEETGNNEYTVQLSTWGCFNEEFLNKAIDHEYIPKGLRVKEPIDEERVEFIKECKAYNRKHGETEIPF